MRRTSLAMGKEKEVDRRSASASSNLSPQDGSQSREAQQAKIPKLQQPVPPCTGKALKPVISKVLDSPRAVSRPFSSSFEVLFTVPSRYLCAIRVLPENLALEGSYLPYSACTIKQAYSHCCPRAEVATHIYPFSRRTYAHVQGYNLLRLRYSTEFCAAPPLLFLVSSAKSCSEIICKHFRRQSSMLPHIVLPPLRRGDFRVGLLHFHSQLLMQSQLISFTSLIYMLKLREFAGTPDHYSAPVHWSSTTGTW